MRWSKNLWLVLISDLTWIAFLPLFLLLLNNVFYFNGMLLFVVIVLFRFRWMVCFLFLFLLLMLKHGEWGSSRNSFFTFFFYQWRFCHNRSPKAHIYIAQSQVRLRVSFLSFYLFLLFLHEISSLFFAKIGVINALKHVSIDLMCHIKRVVERRNLIVWIFLSSRRNFLFVFIHQISSVFVFSYLICK